MTREEAISIITKERDEDIFGCWTPYRKRIHEAFTLAIEALEGVCFDEWCTDCKEYDTEKKCCPRFNKVIREALKREPSEDGTLEVKVEDATKVGRVLISDDEHRGGLYYPDEYEPKGEDLISRAEAIYEIHDFFFKVTDELPRVVDEDGDEVIADMESMTELLALNKELCERINALPSADRPRGRWHYSDGKPATIGQSFGVICDQCGTESEYCTNFCGECGADMRGGTE